MAGLGRRGREAEAVTDGQAGCHQPWGRTWDGERRGSFHVGEGGPPPLGSRAGDTGVTLQDCSSWPHTEGRGSRHVRGTSCLLLGKLCLRLKQNTQQDNSGAS